MLRSLELHRRHVQERRELSRWVGSLFLGGAICGAAVVLTECTDGGSDEEGRSPRGGDLVPAKPTATPDAESSADALPASPLDAGSGHDAAPPGVLRTLATGESHPRAIAVAGGFAYFTVYEGAALRRVSVDGGAVNTVVANFEDALAVTVDDEFVYAATTHPHGIVIRQPLDGGPIDTLASDEVYPTALVVSGGTAYFTTSSAVKSVPITGGAISVVASSVAGPNGIAVAGGTVFFTVYNDGTIRAASGGTVSIIVSGQSYPSGIVVANGRVVFTCTGDGTVKSALPDGGDLRTLTSGWSYPVAILADGPWLYFTAAGGDIVRVRGDGTDLTVLATKEKGPEGLAVDATSVYWVTHPAGEVRSLTPK